MTDADNALHEWLEQIDRLEAVPWDRLPELDLYMDQVITLMNKQLSAVSVDSDRPLTSSMINNYVKDGVMPRPIQKKYNREHLTVMLMICMLKSVFSLPEIRGLVEGLSRFNSSEQLYTVFHDAEQQALRRAADRLRDMEQMSESDRYLLAMELALEANADRIVAARLLESLSDPSQNADKEKKDKEKEKKDKEKDKKKKEKAKNADAS